ncbi:MAG TPA: carbohydrate-binding family 9-like protein [Armatimonadota bacterium]|jgi:hypothetical protein
MADVVLVIPRVEAPDIDQAFLTSAQWASIPAVTFVCVADGEAAALPTELRPAWSGRGVHLRYRCIDPLPLSREFARDAPIDEEEVVGVFLDPVGERSQYLAILVSPYGRVADARIENPRHHAQHSEVDLSWDCSGVRVRSSAGEGEWTIELLIPFAGMTPAIRPPSAGDRWTGNFFRIERQPFVEITAWQPTRRTPIDLHDTEVFGIIEFGG